MGHKELLLCMKFHISIRQNILNYIDCYCNNL